MKSKHEQWTVEDRKGRDCDLHDAENKLLTVYR